eukprot:637575-Heterocapsa_arctica.AAC.1
MRKERGDISQYGAVRMTKAEAKEMIRTNQKYQNFWVYVTVYEEMEARGEAGLQVLQRLWQRYLRRLCQACGQEGVQEWAHRPRRRFQDHE